MGLKLCKWRSALGRGSYLVVQNEGLASQPLLLLPSSALQVQEMFEYLKTRWVSRPHVSGMLLPCRLISTPCAANVGPSFTRPGCAQQPGAMQPTMHKHAILCMRPGTCRGHPGPEGFDYLRELPPRSYADLHSHLHSRYLRKVRARPFSRLADVAMYKQPTCVRFSVPLRDLLESSGKPSEWPYLPRP